MPYCTPASLGELLEDAGLRDVAVSSIVVGAEYASFDDLWAPLEPGMAPPGAYVTRSTSWPRHFAPSSTAVSRRPPARSRSTARAWAVRGQVTA